MEPPAHRPNAVIVTGLKGSAPGSGLRSIRNEAHWQAPAIGPGSLALSRGFPSRSCPPTLAAQAPRQAVVRALRRERNPGP